MEKEAIERVRQLLYIDVYRERSDQKLNKKQVVRQLLAPLMAERNSGRSFENIAAVFAEGGLNLTADTLRVYFYEVRADDELAAEAQKHAEKVRKTRIMHEQRRMSRREEHAERVAREFITQADDGDMLVAPVRPALATQPRLDNDVATLERPVAHDVATSPQRRAARPPAVDARPAPTTPSAPEKTVVRENLASPSSVTQKNDAAPLAPSALVTPGARTLEEVERDSEATDERTIIDEDVVLKDGLVVGVSGRPFVGFLTGGQRLNLRQGGRLIAPTRGRTSHQIVKMPSRL